MESRFYFARETEDTRTINSAGFKLPKETLCWSFPPPTMKCFPSRQGDGSIKWTRDSFLGDLLAKLAPWPMLGQCYVTPVAKRLINASLFQSSLRRKWSGSTSTNPDKAIPLLCTVFSVLQGVSKRGDDLSLFSLFSISFTAQCFSLPLFSSSFSLRGGWTPYHSSLLPGFITGLRSNSVFPCSSINSETFSSQLSPSCLQMMLRSFDDYYIRSKSHLYFLHNFHV